MSVAMVIPEIGFDEAADDADDAARHRHEEEPEDDDEEAREQRPGERAREGREEGDDGDERDAAADDDRERQVALGALARGVARAARADRGRESRKLETMVGSVLMSVITPAHATAPAPM